MMNLVAPRPPTNAVLAVAWHSHHHPAGVPM